MEWPCVQCIMLSRANSSRAIGGEPKGPRRGGVALETEIEGSKAKKRGGRSKT